MRTAAITVCAKKTVFSPKGGVFEREAVFPSDVLNRSKRIVTPNSISVKNGVLKMRKNRYVYGVTLNAKREKLSFRIFFYRMER